MSKLCKSTTSSCVIFLLFGVAIMDKEALDPNLSPPPSRGKRPASEPVRSSTPRRQQPKRRASTKNRRRDDDTGEDGEGGRPNVTVEDDYFAVEDAFDPLTAPSDNLAFFPEEEPGEEGADLEDDITAEVASFAVLADEGATRELGGLACLESEVEDMEKEMD
ncbi:hypothetical protein H632_c2508p0, partial [Helicosporidium sp. ATCC 50920]